MARKKEADVKSKGYEQRLHGIQLARQFQERN